MGDGSCSLSTAIYLLSDYVRVYQTHMTIVVVAGRPIR
jgi:hypothetical protein